jgi:ArsR family transcriptional regulator, virulence genes transcriptional regulator
MHLWRLAPKAEQAEGFLKALANRHRLMILCEPHQGEASVTALWHAVGLPQSSLSLDLARLREDGLVKTRRQSQAIFYSLADPHVSRMIGLLYELYCADDCAPKEKRGRRPPAAKAACSLAPRNRKEEPNDH